MAGGVLNRGKRRNYLWVEGKDDEVIMYGLLNSHLITSQTKRNRFIATNEFFEVREHDGIRNLLDALRVGLKGDAVDDRYGLIVDADDDLDSIWRKLQSILSTSGYGSIPTAPALDGTILRQEGLPI